MLAGLVSFLLCLHSVSSAAILCDTRVTVQVLSNTMAGWVALDSGAADWQHCLAIASVVLKLEAFREQSRAVAPGNS